jgi:putative ABC transport system permease protein
VDDVLAGGVEGADRDHRARMIPKWRRYVRFWGADPAADVDEELQFHIESRVHDYVAEGMTVEAARAEALRRFGDVSAVRRSCEEIDHLLEQERRRADMWEALMQDLRYAARALRRSPGFTLIAVLTLALGIGANTAIFSVVNGVLLRPLPYPSPDRLVRVYTSFGGSGISRYSMSQPEFMDYKGLTHVFQNAAAFTGTALTLTSGCSGSGGACEPQRVRGITATRDLFPVLGITPLRGRNFEGDEGRAGREPVTMVTYDFWQRQFGGDPTLLGRSLTMNGVSRRVIGILPPDATIARAEAFIPLYINPDSLEGRSTNYLSGVARLAPNISVQQAQRELNALTRALAARYPNVYPPATGYGATVISMHEAIVGDIRPALLILLGAVGLVLLIACANVANLLLARGEARQREIAVRLALGADRGRIVRQLLTESAVLAVAGGIVGLLLAWIGTKSLLAVNPDAIPRLELVRIDATVGLVTLGIALATGIVFGLAPALQLAQPELQSSLKEGTRGGSVGTGQQRLGRALVAGEVALAVVVVIGAALLVRSFWTLRNVDPGFDPSHVLAIDLSIPSARYDPNATTVFYRRLIERVGALPGVTIAAGASDLPPVSGGSNWDVEILGRPRARGTVAPSPNVRVVTADYFKTLSIALMKGRMFGRGDTGGSTPVAMINEAAAREIWPGGDPVGQQIRFSPTEPWITVVGVARDVRSTGLGAPVPDEVYLLHEQMPAITESTAQTMYVIMRTAGDPLLLATAARQAVRDLDPLIAITNIRTMTKMIDLSVAQPRFTMLLLGVFGGVALTLAVVGIYGIMAHAVKRRTREIGIRMALGARPTDVLRLVVGQGMRLAVLGLVVGVVAALAATRLMADLLFGVKATDPLTYVGSVVVLGAVAFAASWIPARRAIAIDPTLALRSD